MSGPYHHGDLRSHLVTCALELLHRDHPEDLSIREVARRAGVSSGAPYHHFGDKIGLLAACAGVGWEALNAELEAIDRDAPLADQLRGRGRVYLDYALSNAGCYRLMMSRLFDDPERFAELKAARARAMGGALELIARSGVVGTEPTAVKGRGVAMWAMLHGFAVLCLDGSVHLEASPDAQVAYVIDLAVRMALLPEAEGVDAAPGEVGQHPER